LSKKKINILFTIILLYGWLVLLKTSKGQTKKGARTLENEIIV